MKRFKLFTVIALFVMAIPCNAQLTINIRYTGAKGAAKKYVKEMEESGIADRIRAVEGCLRYDYFFPADDPEGLLLIDEWADQAALDRYHASPMMGEAAALREKYELGGRQIRRFNPLAQDARAFVQTVDFSVWPQGQPNTAYAQYFTGNSYLAPMDGGVANVTFEPGCRNNWHIHHRQVQVLICVAGRGWYQEWGKPAVQLVPGTIIEIPEGAKHWHGAAADSWMQHLTFHKDVQDGASNEWLEPVSDEQYRSVRN